MRTGEMKYVILRIDTHVLRIDLCPRKRTRIRRQKQDEDVHLFLSERKKARASADGPCRGREAGRIPECTYHGRGGRLRTPANLAWYPKGPECTYHGRGVLHTPPKRAARPEWDGPGRPVGPPDHSPGRNPGRRNPGRLRTPANLAGYPKGPECTYHGRGVLHTPPKRAARPEWDGPGRPVGPPDHSPGRNPGRRNPGRLRTPANLAGYPKGPECTYPGRPVGPPDHSPGRNPGAHGYPGTCIRPVPGRPVGRMLLRLLHGYPQQTNGAQPPTNQHQTGL